MNKAYYSAPVPKLNGDKISAEHCIPRLDIETLIGLNFGLLRGA